MKMRLKPLRGKVYDSAWGFIQFIEPVRGSRGLCRVLMKEKIEEVDVDGIRLPIIDTKDYEKIADEKYHGD